MPLPEPTAALVIIGAEVLSGKVEDANAPFLVRALRGRGVEVVEIRTIGDDVPTIAATVTALASRADLVITTGGIGPTHDDVTIAGVAAALGVQVVRHPEIEQRLRLRAGGEPNAAVLKMAEVPAGARVILDAESLLPIVQAGKITILPGVPSLVRWCFERLSGELRGAPFYTHSLYLGVHESSFAEHLTRVQEQHPRVSIGSYPRTEPAGAEETRRVRVKVTVDGRDPEVVRAAVEAVRGGIPGEWLVREETSVVGDA